MAMATFYGTDRYSIDEKGRLIVPASMRRVSEGEEPLNVFVLLRGADRCLWMYALEDWKDFEDKLRGWSLGTTEQRKVARQFLAGAIKVTVDKQGRISIPSSLVSHAGLGKEAILHGHVGRIEIWNPDAFQSDIEEVTDFSSLVEKVMGGGH